jgi:hypothetical protein
MVTHVFLKWTTCETSWKLAPECSLPPGDPVLDVCSRNCGLAWSVEVVVRHDNEVVPGLVEVEVAVPRSRPAVW